MLREIGGIVDQIDESVDEPGFLGMIGSPDGLDEGAASVILTLMSTPGVRSGATTSSIRWVRGICAKYVVLAARPALRKLAQDVAAARRLRSQQGDILAPGAIARDSRSSSFATRAMVESGVPS